MSLSLTTFLNQALEQIERDAPASFTALQRAMLGTTARVDIGRDSATLLGHAGGLRVSSAATACDVVVRSSRAALRTLVEGEVTLLDALLDGRIFVCAAPDGLDRFHAAFIAFVAGAARSLEFPALLETLLTDESDTPLHC